MTRIAPLLLAAAVILALLLCRFYFTDADFGLTNPAWNGLSGLSGDVKDLYALSDLAAAEPNSTLLIVGPAEAYGEADAAQVLSYLRRGGRVVVLDDYGSANSLLTGLGSPITLNQQPLCQADPYYRSYSFPEITDLGNRGIVAGARTLVLDHPVSLRVVGDAEILANTSGLAWIDPDGGGYINGTEVFSRYPVIARAKYGAGELTVVADPDVLINAVSGLGDNDVLRGNLLGAKPVYLDVSHGRGSAPLAYLAHLVRADPAAQLLAVLLVLLAGYGIFQLGKALSARRRRSPATQRPLTSAEALALMQSRLPLKEHEVHSLKKKL